MQQHNAAAALLATQTPVSPSLTPSLPSVVPSCRPSLTSGQAKPRYAHHVAPLTGGERVAGCTAALTPFLPPLPGPPLLPPLPGPPLLPPFPLSPSPLPCTHQGTDHQVVTPKLNTLLHCTALHCTAGPPPSSSPRYAQQIRPPGTPTRYALQVRPADTPSRHIPLARPLFPLSSLHPPMPPLSTHLHPPRW
ncbi:unnamed protein product [Closterium sp. NIES-65]|nr:unnamed protein product [Closterium sp. NIES-65]